MFQDVPYSHKREHNEGHKVAHVSTTALGHHGVYPTESASKQTPSIEHLPFHTAYQVVLTAHLYMKTTYGSKSQDKTVSCVWWENGNDPRPSVIRVVQWTDRSKTVVTTHLPAVMGPLYVDTSTTTKRDRIHRQPLGGRYTRDEFFLVFSIDDTRGGSWSPD